MICSILTSNSNLRLSKRFTRIKTVRVNITSTPMLNVIAAKKCIFSYLLTHILTYLLYIDIDIEILRQYRIDVVSISKKWYRRITSYWNLTEWAHHAWRPPGLRGVHWLPVRRRIELAGRCIWQDDECNTKLTTVTDRWRLRSSTVATCEAPRGRSIFHCCWTAFKKQPIPLHLRLNLLSLEFRRLLKTHLFYWGPRRLAVAFRAPYLWWALRRI